MKPACLLFLLLSACGLPLSFVQAQTSSQQDVKLGMELGQDCSFKDGQLVVQPYQDERVWFKGVWSNKQIRLKPSDSFTRIYDGLCNDYRFDGVNSGALSITHRAYSYLLGPAERDRKKLLKQKLLKTEHFTLPIDLSMLVLIDYPIFLESKIKPKQGGFR
jgi:hypothetical protein